MQSLTRFALILILLWPGLAGAEQFPRFFQNRLAQPALPEGIGGHSMFISPALGVIHPDSRAEGIILTLAGEEVPVRAVSTERRTSGYSWFGKVEGCELCDVVLTVEDGVLSGSVRAIADDYEIVGTAHGDYLLTRKEPVNKVTWPDDPPRPPASRMRTERAAPDSAAQAAQAAESIDRTIDILALVTSELAGTLGSGLASRLQLFEDIANDSLSNSEIGGRYHIVAIQESTDDRLWEGVTIDQALDRLTDDPDVAGLRDAAGADVVTLLRHHRGYQGGCGLAWLLDSILGYPDFAYAVVEVRDASEGISYCDETTFAHEIGHLLGAVHDRDHASGPGLYPYSYGYDVPGTFATVMSYDEPTIHYFSNPRVAYAGLPIGVPKQQIDAADNALTFANSIPIVAAYRAGSQSSDEAYRQVQGGYVAYYGRPADPPGQDYWAGRLVREGGSLDAIIEAFGTSQEFTARYGNLAVGELIDTVYQQMFGRDPDAAGKAFYIDLIKSGQKSLQTTTLDVLNGAQNEDLIIVNNKVDVADYFTALLRSNDKSDRYSLDNLAEAAAILGAVTADPSSVAIAKGQADQLVASW